MISLKKIAKITAIIIISIFLIYILIIVINMINRTMLNKQNIQFLSQLKNGDRYICTEIDAVFYYDESDNAYIIKFSDKHLYYHNEINTNIALFTDEKKITQNSTTLTCNYKIKNNKILFFNKKEDKYNLFQNYKQLTFILEQ